MNRRKDFEAERPSFAPHVSLSQLGRISRPRPETWGPPPLHPFLVQEQQDNLLARAETQALDNVIDGTPEVIAAQIVNTAGTRFVGRMVANYDNLAHAERLGTPLSPQQRHIAQLGLAGVANPAELTYVADLIGARGVALGTVTHAFGVGIKHLAPMREATDKTLELFNAEALDQTPTFRIKQIFLDGNEPEAPAFGLLMTRKKDLGKVAGRIWFRERSSFILRLDEASGISKNERQILEGMIATGEIPEDPITPNDDAYSEIFDLLESDEFSTAIPLATTAYEFDETAPRPINNRVGSDATTNYRKNAPNLTYQLTQTQLRMAGVPTTLQDARDVSLDQLVALPKKKP